MANIVCITSGLRGLLNASFELVSRLEKAGHSVTYACPHDVSEAVTAQGISYVQLPPVNFSPAPPPPQIAGPFSGIRTRIAEWKSAPARRRAALDNLKTNEIRNFLQSRRPDLVLLDAELYEHIFTAYSAGFNIALLTPFFCTWKRPGIPPLQTNITPGVGWKGSRIGLELVWLSVRSYQWFNAKKTALRYAFTDRRSVLWSYARQVSFPVDSLERYSWITLFNDSRLPILSLTARELEFPHRTRARLHYIGPLVSTSRKEPDVASSDIARLKALYMERRTSGRPLIYCSLTTMDQEDQGLLPRVIAAVARHPEWLLIVGYNRGATLTIDKLPAHIHLFDYVPQADVLQHTDLCITHGGVNSINECLLFTVPMIVYSNGFADKHGCAARLAYHGLGVNADIDSDDSFDVERRISETLDDEKMQQGLRKFRVLLERYRSDHVLETTVESLLETPIRNR